MDGGAWQATVHGVARFKQDLVTKPPPPQLRCGKLRGKKIGYIFIDIMQKKKNYDYRKKHSGCFSSI